MKLRFVSREPQRQKIVLVEEVLKSLGNAIEDRFLQLPSSIYNKLTCFFLFVCFCFCFLFFFSCQSCPKVVHDLMLNCWNKDLSKRPTFTVIRETLEKWIGNPDLLLEIASVVTKGLVNIINCKSSVIIVISRFLFFLPESSFSSIKYIRYIRYFLCILFFFPVKF